MLTQMEMKDVLRVRIPSCEIDRNEASSIYKAASKFTDHTKELIKTGNLPLVRECFDTADYLLREGNQQVKNAIENIFIFSLGAFLRVTGAISRQVKEMLSPALKEVYQKQVKASLGE